MKSLLDGRPRGCLPAPDRHRPIRAMAVIVLDVEIALRFTEVGYDLFVRPFVAAESRPGVVILGEAALHGLTVDRRSAADPLALSDMDLPLLLGDRTPQGPSVFRVLGLGKSCMAEFDVVREMVRVGIVWPGFQQQHGSMCVCRQSTGQYAPRRSPADNHDVIFHELSFTDIRGFSVRFGYRLAFLRL